MSNPYLIIVTVILTLAIIIGSIYLVVYFQHPEDKNVAWFPKVIVVLGLALACFSILMLPLDVANTTTSGGFPMDALWLAIYIIIAAMIVLVIPFATFYYESEEFDDAGNKSGSQLVGALKGTGITFVIFAIITVIMYLFLGIAEIPIVRIQNSLITVIPPSSNETGYNTTNFSPDLITPTNTDSNITYYPYRELLPLTTREWTTIRYRVSFILYIITMLVFVGWILFIIFGGVGFVAFPFDCINTWRRRPIRIPIDVYSQRKKEIGERATKLLALGRAMKDKQRQRRRERRRDRRNYNKFRQAVYLLEEDYERLQLCYKRQGGKIILYFLSLILGCFGVALTIMWLLHILLYVFTQPYPIHPFLNIMLIKLDDAFGLLGTIAYGIFAFYLLLCCIKGNFKFGMRLFFLFPIHPMKIGGTLMNAFLFNTLLILICAVAVTEFTTTAFSDYTTQTAINSLFAVSVRNMMGIKYIFIGYIYALFIMAFLSGIYLAIKPKEKPASDDIVI